MQRSFIFFSPCRFAGVLCVRVCVACLLTYCPTSCSIGAGQSRCPSATTVGFWSEQRQGGCEAAAYKQDYPEVHIIAYNSVNTSLWLKLMSFFLCTLPGPCESNPKPFYLDEHIKNDKVENSAAQRTMKDIQTTKHNQKTHSEVTHTG